MWFAFPLIPLFMETPNFIKFWCYIAIVFLQVTMALRQIRQTKVRIKQTIRVSAGSVRSFLACLMKFLFWQTFLIQSSFIYCLVYFRPFNSKARPKNKCEVSRAHLALNLCHLCSLLNVVISIVFSITLKLAFVEKVRLNKPFCCLKSC